MKFTFSEIQIRFAPNPGDRSPNFSHPNGLLHSSRSPQMEAKRCAQDIMGLALSDRESKVIVVIGIGWGYLIEKLLSTHHLNAKVTQGTKNKLAHDISFLFFEPIPAVHQLLSEKNRLSAFTELGARLFHHWEWQRLEEELKQEKKIHIYISPVYKRLFPNLLEQLNTTLLLKRKVAKETSLDHDTAKIFLKQWTRNAFCLVTKQKKIYFLSHKKKHIVPLSFVPPLVYCGASPSLLTDIQNAPDDAFYIASDTALGPLISRKKHIGLAICVDSGRGSFYHLRSALRYYKKGKNSFDFPALTWSGALPHLHQFFPKVFYYRSTLPFDQILSYGPLYCLREWENPARNPLGLAVHIAHLLGAKELYCIGTSFLSENGTSHERGTGYQEYGLDQVKRNFTAHMYTTKGYHENKLTPKNQVAWTGALQLGKTLDVKIKKINTKKNISNKLSLSKIRGEYIAKPTLTSEKLLQNYIDIPSISAKEIQTFLQDKKDNIEFSAMTSLGLKADCFHRYMRFF